MFKVNQKSYRKIYPGQKDYTFSHNGITLVPRAMVEILPECPWQVRDQINYALAKGWLQVVSNLPEDELMWENLKNET